MKMNIVLVFLMLLGCASSQKVERIAKKAKIYYDHGTESLINKNYTEALSSLLKADQLDPNNTEILNNLGMAYYFKGKNQLAIQTINKALDADEKNSDARINLATIYLESNMLKKAKKLYLEVSQDLVYKHQYRTYYNLGILSLRMNDKVAAQNYFKKSLDASSAYCPSHFQLGLLNFRQQKYPAALNHFQEASNGQCYKNPAPQYYQALTLLELKKYKSARIKLDEVIKTFKSSEYETKARMTLSQIDILRERDKLQSNSAKNEIESKKSLDF